jgi:hypothetical protein
MNDMLYIPKLVVHFVNGTVKRSEMQQPVAEVKEGLVDKNVSNKVQDGCLQVWKVASYHYSVSKRAGRVVDPDRKYRQNDKEIEY